jgi:hypothetical protein
MDRPIDGGHRDGRFHVAHDRGAFSNEPPRSYVTLASIALLLTVTAAAPTQSLLETQARAIVASWYTPSVLAITGSRA